MRVKIYCHGCKTWCRLVGSSRIILDLEETYNVEQGEYAVHPNTSEFACECFGEEYNEEYFKAFPELAPQDHEVLIVM